MLLVFAIVCAFVLLDVIAGLAAAIKNKELSSSVMHEGLYNKLGEVLLLVVSMFVASILDVHPFTQLGIPPEVMYLVALYITLMELVSILENICKLNPNLPIAKILDIFDIEVDGSGDDDVESKQAPGE